MVKQIGIFRLILGDPPHIYVSIEIEGECTMRFHADHLIDLKRMVDDAIQTSIYRLEKSGEQAEANYLKRLQV